MKNKLYTVRSRLLSIILALTIALMALPSYATFQPASSDETVSASEMRDALVSRGLPRKFVESLFDVEISKLYEETDGRSLSLHENSNHAVSSRSIPDYALDFSMHFVVSSYTTGSEAGYIEHVYVYVSYEWAEHEPTMKLTDGITVNWDTSEFLYSSSRSEFEFIQYYSDDDGWHLTTPDYDTPEFEDQGIGFTFGLDSHYTDPIGGRAVFKVFPKYGDIKENGHVSNRVRASFDAEYRHIVLPIDTIEFDVTDRVHITFSDDDLDNTKSYTDFVEFYTVD